VNRRRTERKDRRMAGIQVGSTSPVKLNARRFPPGSRHPRLPVAQVAWASRPCALARVHGQDPAFAGGYGGQVARATLLAS